MLRCCRRLTKKDRGRLLLLIGDGGGGENVQFYFRRPHNFLFRSAAAAREKVITAYPGTNLINNLY